MNVKMCPHGIELTRCVLTIVHQQTDEDNCTRYSAQHRVRLGPTLTIVQYSM